MRSTLTLTLSAVVTAGMLVTAHARTLTVYTYESFVAEWGPGPEVTRAFEGKCGCTLNWVALADGVAMLNRLRLEGKAATADMVLGLDNHLVAEAKATGLFTTHGVDLTDKLVIDWSDDMFVPFDHGHFAVVYDSEAVKTPPTSLKQLVDGDPAQRIVIQDPRTSTPGLGLLIWMRAVFGDEAPKAWEKLSKRVLTVTPGWSEAYGLFLKGEAQMVLSYTTSPAYHAIADKTDRYKAAIFEEGHVAQIEVAGILASSKNADLARAFLEFMVSPAFQDIIPTTNWMMPAGKLSGALPDAFAKLPQPAKTIGFTSAEIAERRKTWINEWLAATGL